MNYNKKCGIIYYEDYPIMIIEVKDFNSKEDYDNFSKICATNLNNLKLMKYKADKEYKDGINGKVSELAQAIQTYLKGAN